MRRSPARNRRGVDGNDAAGTTDAAAAPLAAARWHVYVLECLDGSLYTGIAIDVEARFQAHLAGKGARYTRARPPRRVLARFVFADRAAATRAEYAIKQLGLKAKRVLCDGGDPLALGIDPERWQPVN